MALIANWVQTTATVDKLEEITTFDEAFTEKKYMPTVRYTVDGVEYLRKNFETYDETDLACKVGEQVQIVYDPGNPKHFTFLKLQKKKARNQMAKLIFWGIVLLIVLWITILF